MISPPQNSRLCLHIITSLSEGNHKDITLVCNNLFPLPNCVRALGFMPLFYHTPQNHTPPKLNSSILSPSLFIKISDIIPMNYITYHLFKIPYMQRRWTFATSPSARIRSSTRAQTREPRPSSNPLREQTLLGVLALEAISYTPHGLDAFPFFTHLCSQFLHMRVNCSCITKIIIIPNAIQDLISG